jgi:hypothetical protein
MINTVWDGKIETHIEQFYAYGNENKRLQRSPMDNNNNNNNDLRHNETRHKLTREYRWMTYSNFDKKAR